MKWLFSYLLMCAGITAPQVFAQSPPSGGSSPSGMIPPNSTATANPASITRWLNGCLPNGGKSVTRVNLAITLAAGGSRALPGDAGLRNDSLHSRFSFQADTRLSETLTQGLDWHKTVKETSRPNYSLPPDSPKLKLT